MSTFTADQMETAIDEAYTKDVPNQVLGLGGCSVAREWPVNRDFMSFSTAMVTGVLAGLRLAATRDALDRQEHYELGFINGKASVPKSYELIKALEPVRFSWTQASAGPAIFFHGRPIFVPLFVDPGSD